MNLLAIANWLQSLSDETQHRGVTIYEESSDDLRAAAVALRKIAGEAADREAAGAVQSDASPDPVSVSASPATISDDFVTVSVDRFADLAAERDAAVAERDQLRNAIGDPDEIIDGVRRHRRDPMFVGNNDFVNDRLLRIADAVAVVSPATPTPTTCPTCHSDDRDWVADCTDPVDPWHTDNTP